MSPKTKSKKGAEKLEVSAEDYTFFHKEWEEFGFMSNYAPAKFTAPDPAIASAPWLKASPEATAAALEEAPAPPAAEAAAADDVPLLDFETSEQYYMYCKAACFSDHKTAEIIRGAASAKDCKDAARHVANFDAAAWDSRKVRVMTDALWFKFGGHALQQVLDSGEWLGRDARLATLPDLGRKLLETGERILVEAAGRDSFWGIGYGIKQRPLNYKKNWGQNQLGKSLMATRDRLRALVDGGE